MKAIKSIFFSAVGVFFLLILLEGAASLTLFIRRILRPLSPVVVQFDDEIGWVGIPHLHINDFYGPGSYLKTNSKGWIMDEEVEENPPPGKKRVVCSGNSFAAGDGVGNRKNLCSQLEKFSPTTQVVNLAQTGYSIDQTFLLFKRHAPQLKHHYHFYMFTGRDFEFMTYPVYYGRYKPQLKLEGQKIIQNNYPLPKNDYHSRYLIDLFKRDEFSKLKTVELARSILARVHSPTKEPAATTSFEQLELEGLKVALSILKELGEMAKSQNVKFVAIYLPTYYDRYLGRHKLLREELKKACKKTGTELYDLTDDLSEFSVQEMVEGGNGHYMPIVHEKIAQLISKKYITY